jgi:hypothetical protein
MSCILSLLPLRCSDAGFQGGTELAEMESQDIANRDSPTGSFTPNPPISRAFQPSDIP